MKYSFLLAITLFMFSCGNEKVIQLPEIEHAEITEINDVSAAYLFYDEPQADSVLLNRKNLISTTNWLVNVDKRLTLKQVIPHIQFLQEKKKNAGHKNPNAKNYFTCHDTSRSNLGFIEFTDVVYDNVSNYFEIKNSVIPKQPNLLIEIMANKNLQVSDLYAEKITKINSHDLSELNSSLLSNLITKYSYSRIVLLFHNEVLFQDYILIKSILSKLDTINVSISNKEFVLD